jgi:hypothetical protein
MFPAVLDWSYPKYRCSGIKCMRTNIQSLLTETRASTFLDTPPRSRVWVSESHDYITVQGALENMSSDVSMEARSPTFCNQLDESPAKPHLEKIAIARQCAVVNPRGTHHGLQCDRYRIGNRCAEKSKFR